MTDKMYCNGRKIKQKAKPKQKIEQRAESDYFLLFKQV